MNAYELRIRNLGPLIARKVLDSAWVYAARTVGVLGLILVLWARAALTERLRMTFGQ